jgi:hypothetical protein
LPASELNDRELQHYLQRIRDRWPVERALLGGARIDGQAGPDYLLVLVSQAFDGVPWLERVHQAASLWDAGEMGAPAEVHCYTPVELERKLEQLPEVRRIVERGVEIGRGER